MKVQRQVSIVIGFSVVVLGLPVAAIVIGLVLA